MTSGSIDIDDTKGDVSGVIKDSICSILTKIIKIEGNLAINNATNEEIAVLRKIQDFPTEMVSPALEKDNFTREEFNALQQGIKDIKKMLERNQAYSIKAGEVQVSRTELSVKEIVVKGNEYISRAEYSIALGYYDQAIEVDPNCAVAWNNKGLALNNLEEYFEAIECYDKALKIDPNCATAWNNKGFILSPIRKYEAIECYDMAIKIDPNYATAWFGKGSVLNSLGKCNEAIECYDGAIKIDPNYATAWFVKGYVLIRLGKCNDAIKCYDRAIEIDPNYVAAWFSKAVVLKNYLGREKEAARFFSKAEELGIKPLDEYLT
jgi:tetratricopeptide (TPR) repeat protein